MLLFSQFVVEEFVKPELGRLDYFAGYDYIGKFCPSFKNFVPDDVTLSVQCETFLNTSAKVQVYSTVLMLSTALDKLSLLFSVGLEFFLLDRP